MLLKSQGEHAFEGLVVAVLLEQRQPRHSPIEGVVDEPARSIACRTWHGGSLAGRRGIVK
jgi:hypothetical protein